MRSRRVDVVLLVLAALACRMAPAAPQPAKHSPAAAAPGAAAVAPAPAGLTNALPTFRDGPWKDYHAAYQHPLFDALVNNGGALIIGASGVSPVFRK